MMVSKATEPGCSAMQLARYLSRIGMGSTFMKEAPSEQFLTYLQQAHMLSIPFEDLDIPMQRIDTDIKKFYDKIVIRLRGGFCYELNGLFHWLITGIGFQASMISACVFNKETSLYGPEFDHMALLATLEREYLVDVGFGDSFRTPISMPDGTTKDVSGVYRVAAVEKDKFELQRTEDNKWLPQYRFSREPRQLADFNEMCLYQQDNPSSHFRTRMLCTIATKTGRITLSNNSLTVTEGTTKTKVALQGQQEFNTMLLKYFNIRI